MYAFVALVSGIHGFAFFGLANNSMLAVMLAVAFEIGQAAVLFSILTNRSQQKKVMPWVLMVILTLVQVMGNVYNSYRYLILNAGDNLRFFKEPLFIWTQLPDAQANVILSYIQGAILPIVALLLTSMVTGFLNDKQNEEEEETIEDEEPENEDGTTEEHPIEEIPDNEEDKADDGHIEPVEEPKEEEQPEITFDEESGEITVTPHTSPKEYYIPQEEKPVEEKPIEFPHEIIEEEKPKKSHFLNL